MKKKNLIIGLVSILVLAGLIITFVLLNSNKLEKKLTNLATEYYEGEAKTYGSDVISQLGYYMVKLSDLKNNDKDISLFEEHNCDLTETYAKLTFKDDKTYDVEVHLACDK